MSREYPLQSYYPQARVRLTLRFDEFSDTPSAEPPEKPVTLRKGAKDKGEVLDYMIDPDAPEGVLRYVLKGKGKTGLQEASGDERTHVIEGIVPRSANLERNSYKEADTLELQLAFLDLPFDPRTLRAVAVEFYLGTIDQDDWAQYIDLGQIPPLPDESDYGSNRKFHGWVDDWRVSWEEGGSVANLSCRDNTSLFIDQPAPPQLKIDPKEEIDKAVAKYLACFPQFEGISVEYRPANETPPKLTDVMQVGNKRNQGAGPDKEKMSVWDYIIDTSGMVGCMCFVEDETIVIQKPRTLYANGFSRQGDPWQGRTTGNLEMKNRTFIYGRNLDTFEVSRRYNENAPRNVEVRCYLPERKKTIVARFPGVTSKVQPGEAADKSIVVWRVQGVGSREALKVIAQSIYEDLGRQEIEVSMKTKSLASFGGDNLEVDALHLQSGDPVDVYFAKDDNGEPVELPANESQMEASALSAEKTAEYLIALGYDPELAAAYATAYADSGFQSTFRVARVMYDWGDDGVSIGIDAVNYVEVRYDKALPDGLEPDPVDQ